MTINAAEILAGIRSGALNSKLISYGDRFAVGLFLGQDIMVSIGCQRSERPTATVSRDGHGVDICPSPGMGGTFSIFCEDNDDATRIAEAVDSCLSAGYLDLVDPHR